MQETWVWSLGWEDPLEEDMATHSSIPVWRIPWAEEPGGLQSMGSKRVGQDWATNHNYWKELEADNPVAISSHFCGLYIWFRDPQ